MHSVPVNFFLARCHVIFQGVAQSKSTMLTAAAALRKAKGWVGGGGLLGKQIKSLKCLTFDTSECFLALWVMFNTVCIHSEKYIAKICNQM